MSSWEIVQRQQQQQKPSPYEVYTQHMSNVMPCVPVCLCECKCECKHFSGTELLCYNGRIRFAIQMFAAFAIAFVFGHQFVKYVCMYKLDVWITLLIVRVSESARWFVSKERKMLFDAQLLCLHLLSISMAYAHSIDRPRRAFHSQTKLNENEAKRNYLKKISNTKSRKKLWLI